MTAQTCNFVDMTKTQQEPSNACKVCGSRHTAIFWEMPDLPVFCNILCKTRDEARHVPKGDIRLAVCHDCGFIRNVAFDPRQVRYGTQYENSLHFSPTFQGYAEDLAAELVERHKLKDKRILEIACGKGDFLKLLCELGNNTGVGFDPGYVAQTQVGDSRFTILPEPYSKRHRDYRADFVCCRHALEHMADPVAFLRVIRDNIGDHHECAVFFEVPNIRFTLCELGIWDIIYEHCSYFGESSLWHCFTEAGFAVESVQDAYDGQFLCIQAYPAPTGADPRTSTSGDLAALLGDTAHFAERFEDKLTNWKNRLRSFADRGKRVVVWGSGSKGVTFLNMTKEAADIEYVVDINPRKTGMYVAGTGQQIVGPEFLRSYLPDQVIVMNPIYLTEITATVEKLEVAPQFQVA